MQRPGIKAMSTPDYLTNFIPQDESSQAVHHMKAIKQGKIDLQAEETILNNIRKGLSGKNNVTD